MLRCKLLLFFFFVSFYQFISRFHSFIQMKGSYGLQFSFIFSRDIFCFVLLVFLFHLPQPILILFYFTLQNETSSSNVTDFRETSESKSDAHGGENAINGTFHTLYMPSNKRYSVQPAPNSNSVNSVNPFPSPPSCNSKMILF